MFRFYLFLIIKECKTDFYVTALFYLTRLWWTRYYCTTMWHLNGNCVIIYIVIFFISLFYSFAVTITDKKILSAIWKHLRVTRLLLRIKNSTLESHGTQSFKNRQQNFFSSYLSLRNIFKELNKTLKKVFPKSKQNFYFIFVILLNECRQNDRILHIIIEFCSWFCV